MKGQIKSRSRGSYTIVLNLPRSKRGEQRRREVFTVRGPRKVAEAEMARRIHEIESGSFLQKTRLTVSEALQKWLKVAQPRIAFKTHARYSQIVRYHLESTIGSLPLAKLAPFHIQDALATWRTTSQRYRRSGCISGRTIHHIFSTLKAALSWAARSDLIVRNACDNVTPPSKPRAEVAAMDEQPGPDPAQSTGRNPARASYDRCALNRLASGRITGTALG